MGKIELIRPWKLQTAHYLETSSDFPVKPYELVGLSWRRQGVYGKTLAQEAWLPEEILIFSPRKYQLNPFVSRKPTMARVQDFLRHPARLSYLRSPLADSAGLLSIPPASALIPRGKEMFKKYFSPETVLIGPGLSYLFPFVWKVFVHKTK